MNISTFNQQQLSAGGTRNTATTPSSSRCASPFLTACCLTKLLKFDIMQPQVDIEFDQLVKLAKQLPPTQWTKLKREVEEKVANPEQHSDLVSLLLSAPTYSKKQLDEVARTRKAINQWRTK